MKSYQYILGVVFTSLAIVSCKTDEKKNVDQDKIQSDKPNVILILVDDQGYGDVAALGNTIIKTPNIDALHASSARFTDYHVNPTCAPTRSALLTGHNANRAGVWHTVNGRSLLLERETTVAQIMKDNGYATGIFGKWHLGDNYPSRPQDKGFEEVVIHAGGGVEQSVDYWDNDYYNDTYHRNGTLEKFEGFCTDIWFDEAMSFMETSKAKDKPFFCYLATNAAHTPYFVDEKYSAPYKDNENVPNANFYGLITNVDENVGRLVDYLKTTNQLDNTILIFTTDNGTSAGAQIPKTDDRLDGFVTKGFNDGMRGIKASKYEGGHRVPLFIHWKNGGITVGKDIDALTAHYDIVPTLVDLCELDVKDDIKFDGQSLNPLINGDDSGFKDRIVITNSQRIDVPEPWRRTSLMQRKWRLVDGTELYDLNTDPEQRTNVADQHPEKMAEFKTAYDLWWADLLPGYSDLPRIYLGHEAENPVKIFSHDWHTESVSPWHQRHIRDGYIDNGYWLIKVEEKGTYNFKLRRYPEETRLALNAEAPIRPAIKGTSVSASKKGKSLKIEKARIKIQDKEEVKDIDANQEYVEFILDLMPGETKLQTWFTLHNKKELGAYYVSVEKL